MLDTSRFYYLQTLVTVLVALYMSVIEILYKNRLYIETVNSNLLN